MIGRIIVDTKESAWYRQYFDLDEEMTVEEFIKGVENGDIEAYDGNYVDDSMEQLSPEDNDGQATLEIYKDHAGEQNLIYKNGL